MRGARSIPEKIRNPDPVVNPNRSKGARLGWKKRREKQRVRQRDVDRLQRDGLVAESIKPFMPFVQEEVNALTAALGGSEAVSPQRAVLIADLAKVGLLMRAELARYVQTGDPDAASRVGTLVNSRRASLIALGLDRVQREVGLAEYLAAREEREPSQTRASGPNGGESDAEITPADDRASESDRPEQPAREGAES